MKTCNRCGVEKVDSEFARKKYKNGNYGLSAFCKVCNNELNKVRRSSYTDKQKAVIREQNWKRRHTPEYILYNRMRKWMERYYHGFPSVNVILEELGYSLTDLKEHIEKQFVDGMSWENSSKWDIDHIIPVAFFPPVSSPKEQAFKDCHALENLQVLTHGDNVKKRSHIALRINSHGGAEIVGVKVKDLLND